MEVGAEKAQRTAGCPGAASFPTRGGSGPWPRSALEAGGAGEAAPERLLGLQSLPFSCSSLCTGRGAPRQAGLAFA